MPSPGVGRGPPRGCRVVVSQSWRVPASPATAMVWPSGLRARALTASGVSPRGTGKTLFSTPVRWRSSPSHKATLPVRSPAAKARPSGLKARSLMWSPWTRSCATLRPVSRRTTRLSPAITSVSGLRAGRAGPGDAARPAPAGRVPMLVAQLAGGRGTGGDEGAAVGGEGEGRHRRTGFGRRQLQRGLFAVAGQLPDGEPLGSGSSAGCGDAVDEPAAVGAERHQRDGVRRGDPRVGARAGHKWGRGRQGADEAVVLGVAQLEVVAGTGSFGGGEQPAVRAE